MKDREALSSRVNLIEYTRRAPRDIDEITEATRIAGTSTVRPRRLHVAVSVSRWVTEPDLVFLRPSKPIFPPSNFIVRVGVNSWAMGSPPAETSRLIRGFIS
jgi:hypothetical protein